MLKSFYNSNESSKGYEGHERVISVARGKCFKPASLSHNRGKDVFHERWNRRVLPVISGWETGKMITYVLSTISTSGKLSFTIEIPEMWMRGWKLGV